MIFIFFPSLYFRFTQNIYNSGEYSKLFVIVHENLKTLLILLLDQWFRGCNFEDLEPVDY